ncbi:MAG TPA: NADH-ubiquinone oxidoreductase-F iron-sulfur binding region domain-containing protein, partial [Planctomycetota bacterium]|nr:NADH-ubiquinone oxidoreductase-F iron-sulfur binding region domain-containing protein [Planctomycetota bacterium]
GLREGLDPEGLVGQPGDGNNAHELVGAMVVNNIRRTGPVIFAETPSGEGLTRALAMTPDAVIEDVTRSGLRGRGGAGFPTGLKWKFTRAAAGERRFVFCNADEGEPGTFKDRVLLTERADMLFEGMTLGGYAVGADTGIVYLRGEYAYLRRYLEHVLEERRRSGMLGKSVCGKEGFDFDIRIQMGAGAYVCGEETALISSCEGRRGDPKNRPPFPAQKGYLDAPTVVNNVETFCCVTRILEKGPEWFAAIGTRDSHGTKLLSVSGDCAAPGVYELPFGVSLSEVLGLAGAPDAAAVQVGGPSGQMLPRDAFARTIAYEDLATGGSVMVFGPGRSVLDIAARFMEFFVEEGCGYCTPCRVGNVLLKERLEQILAGKGSPEDLAYLQELGETVRLGSRCGLGQTSANPVLTTLKNFRTDYEALLREPECGRCRTFDIRAALADAEAIAGRKSVHFTEP